MVQDYDIYYRKSPTSHTGYRITQTAVPGVVSHGVPDWLYEGKSAFRLAHNKYEPNRSNRLEVRASSKFQFGVAWLLSPGGGI